MSPTSDQAYVPASRSHQAFQPGPPRGPVLITGANGLLGQFLVKELVDSGRPVLATNRGDSRLPSLISPEAAGSAFCPALGINGSALRYQEMDFTDPEQVHRIIHDAHPSVIVHAGAMTQVDPCELDPESCRKVNVLGTELLLKEAAKTGSRFIFLSTDFIFDGKSGPYREEDAPHPLSAYGRSKWEAEQKIMAVRDLDWAIVRTVLVYGTPLVGTRSNIITWVKSNLEAGNPINVVSDQWRTPTYVGDLAHSIKKMINRSASGVYHISGKDFLTPYDMAVKTARLLNLDESLLNKVDAATFTQPGPRPAVTGFVIDKAVRDLGYAPVDFEEGIRLTLGMK